MSCQLIEWMAPRRPGSCTRAGGRDVFEAVFIPVGLIARLVIGAMDDAGDQQTAEAMQRAGLEHEEDKHNARVRELWSACGGANACLLVLGNNEWAGCTVDGIALPPQPAAGPPAASGYRAGADVLGHGPHGLVGMCPGRHWVVSKPRGRSVVTTFVLHPREAFFLKLDGEAGRFTRYETSEEEAILRRAAAGELALVDYGHVASSRINAFQIKSSQEALRECASAMTGVLRLILAGNTTEAVQETQRAGAALVGAPVMSFEPITTFVGFQAFELVSKGKHGEAWALLQAGLAVLPDHPTLLAAQGEIQLRAGDTAAGIANLAQALARPAGLDPALHARVKSLLAAG